MLQATLTVVCRTGQTPAPSFPKGQTVFVYDLLPRGAAIGGAFSGTRSRPRRGPVPAAGSWKRREIPLDHLGPDSGTLTRIDVAHVDGRVWLDRIALWPLSCARLTSFSSDREMTVTAGTTVTWTATATVYPLQYRFDRRDDAGTWSTVQSYGRANTYTWTPAAASPALPRRHSLYTPELHLLAETEVTTASKPPIAYEYVWFAAQPLAQIATATGEIHWYFNDHLGTPILQTASDATVVWRVEYDPYGTVFSARAGVDKHQPLRFPGQENDGATELAYNVFRWYRAGWGRYTQADPIGIGGQGHFDARSGSLRTYNAVDAERGTTIGASTADLQVNPYSYAAANSLRNVDRLGLWPCIVFSVNSTADYMLQISGPVGSTFKGCLYTGICGTPNYQYLAVYERTMKLGCKCPTFCIFQIDLHSGVRTTPGTCFDIPWPSFAPSPPLVGPLW